MSDGDDGYDGDDADYDDDGGGYGGGGLGGRYLGRGSRGSAVQSLQSRLSALGFQCRVDGIFGPETEGAVRAFQQSAGIKVDGKAGKDTFRKLAEAEQRRSAARRQSASSEGFFSGSSARGGSASSSTSALGSLIGLAIIIGVGYWFVTVVLPILLAIIAALFGLVIVFLICRFCVQHFGWAATLKGLAVVTGVPLLIVAYIANFTGDFEAVRSGEIGRVEPSRRASSCGPSVSEGDNLNHVEPRQIRDTLDGRWARIDVKGTSCWVAYSDLRFQHGIVMTIVGKVIHRTTTDEESRQARAQALESVERESERLYDAGSWSELAALGGRLYAEGHEVTSSTATRIEMAATRMAFDRLMQQYESSSDPERSTRYRVLRDLAARTNVDRSELDRRHASWIEARCQRVLSELETTEQPLDVRIRRLSSIAQSCSTNGDATLASRAEALASELSQASDRPPFVGSSRRVSSALSALVTVAPRSETLRQRLQAHDEAIAQQEGEVARDCAPTTAERCLAVRCAPREPPLDALTETRARLVRRAVETRVRAGVTALLSALSNPRSGAVSVGLLLAPFDVTDDALLSVLRRHRAAWRVQAIDLDDCARRASVTLVRPTASSYDARTVSLSMCFHEFANRWFICKAATEDRTS